MVDEYNATMEIMLKLYEEKSAPAMPCYGCKKPQTGSDGQTLQPNRQYQGEVLVSELEANQQIPRSHEEKIAMLGDQSEQFMALIHTAIPDAKMYKIPKA